ncbi:MAG: DUF1460 domain-containing protein [Rubricoccaceae bacterium]|nr:DUF1460 domain-containing protein [Rubricoccaceae bacterium]
MSRISLFALLTLLLACTEASDGYSPGTLDSTVVAVSDTVDTDAATVAVFDRIVAMAQANRLSERPIGQIVQVVGEALAGTPYQDGLLDHGMEETLVVDLTAFDCVLFVENVLALAQGIAQEDYAFDSYVSRLENLRYRAGSRDGYCSRLHYFTDWIQNNAERDQIVDITADLGGEPLEKTLNFMSTHREAYARLVADSTYSCIVNMEQDIRDRDLIYIPQQSIRSVYPYLEAGDVIATATHISGLDVTHTGFAYLSDDGQVGFLHASSTGEVKVAEDLRAYVEANDVQIGIIVARPLDPRDNP